MTTPRTDELPEDGELWVVFNSSADDEEMETSSNTRFAIMECLGVLTESPDYLPDIDTIRENMAGTPFKGRYLYDADDSDRVGEVGHAIANWMWYYRLPEDPEDFDEKYEDVLDYALGLVTRKDVADLLAGEPSYQTNGEDGYEALRFFALEGIQESITERSVHQGHGASRYGRAVEERIEDLPTWLASSVLYSEKERWDGGFELSDEAAAKIVEVLELKQQYLDEDHEEEIRELVNEHDLEYDEYREVNGGETA